MHDNAIFSVIDTKKNRLKRSIIAELYRAESGTISQLANLIHTSIPSMTALIDELNVGQWVRSIGTGTAQYGRKPSLFALTPFPYATVVVDITVHDTKLVVFNLANQVLHRVDLPLQLENSVSFLDNLRGALADLTYQIQADELVVIGSGVAMPGLVNPIEGINHTYPEVTRNGQSLSNLLQSVFDAPVFLINDTKAMLVGEHRFGLAQGKNFVLSINIDWGIGLGVITNGAILQGTAGFAGELGHIQMKTDGELCTCGKIGCLETVASASSLIRRAKAGLREGRVSTLAERDPDTIAIELIIEKANAGDTFCIDLLNDVGSELGRGLATAVHLFNPELIIVNGVLAKATRAITRPIEQAIAKYSLLNYQDNLSIELSRLGEMAKLYGTQAYILQNLLDLEFIP